MPITTTPRKILLIRLDFLGDMICTTPLLAALRQEYPGARIAVLATRYNRVALDRNPDIDVVYTYVFSKQSERNERPGMLRTWWDRLRLLRRLRSEHFDLVLIPNGGMNKNSINFARQLGAAQVIHRDANNEFDDRNPEHVRNRPIEHEALSGFRLLGLDPGRHAPLRLRLYPDPAQPVTLPNASGRPRLGLFVTARDPARIWPTEHWATLARTLAADFQVIFLWSPGPAGQVFIRGDDDQAATLRRQLDGIPGINFVPTPTVADLFAVAARLDYAVTPDGAPVHVCAALQRPLVALFENRREKYDRWSPLGVAHRLLHAEAGATVGDIGPATVRAAVVALHTECSAAPPAATSDPAAHPAVEASS